jgi:dihydroxyacid dehydratase/phosphogluconate dehydratase
MSKSPNLGLGISYLGSVCAIVGGDANLAGGQRTIIYSRDVVAIEIEIHSGTTSNNTDDVILIESCFERSA